MPKAPTPERSTDMLPARVPTASVMAPPTMGMEFDRKNRAVLTETVSAAEFIEPVIPRTAEKTVIAMPSVQNIAFLTADVSPLSLISGEKAQDTERARYIPEKGVMTVPARVDTTWARPKTAALTAEENAALPIHRRIPQ